ncbi:MAG: hypothetical protein E6J43_07850, partial [Chloroflexi bacterium]
VVVKPRPSGPGTRLFTETRVRCLGVPSRRWFRLYWLVIRPFSGLLRRSMLRGIKIDAIRQAHWTALGPGRS